MREEKPSFLYKKLLSTVAGAGLFLGGARELHVEEAYPVAVKKMPQTATLVAWGGVHGKSGVYTEVLKNNTRLEEIPKEHLDYGFFAEAVEQAKLLRGKKSLKVVVITTSCGKTMEGDKEEADVYGKYCVDLLTHLFGKDRVSVSYVGNYSPEKDEAHAKDLDEADVIFKMGGNQGWLIEGLGTEKALQALKKAGKNPLKVIAGTSAGAAAMSPEEVMINGGSSDEPGSVIKNLSKGLGFLKYILDTHVYRAGTDYVRIGRMLEVAEKYPERKVIGLDERTGLKIKDEIAEVIGHRQVYIVIHHLHTHDFPEDKKHPFGEGPGEAAFLDKNFSIYVFKPGDIIDLDKCCLIQPKRIKPQSSTLGHSR